METKNDSKMEFNGVSKIVREGKYPVDCGENTRCRFVALGAIGWRDAMEDAHVNNLDLGDGNMLFCVFDGHGGREVARYAGQKFSNTLISQESYQSKDYDKALTDTFYEIDKMIKKNTNDVFKHSYQYDPDFPD